MDEFDIIRRFFERDEKPSGVVIGIGDDGAEIQPDADRNLITVIDTLVANVHFPNNMCAEDIGYRVVAVNLSDIAAMGARPRWMTLALTLDVKDRSWLGSFTKGLFAAADEFDVALVGGDTTSGEQLVVTVQIIGDIAVGQAIKRSGARSGDGIYVTGTIGDAAAGLDLLKNENSGTAHADYLRQRFCRPAARIDFGQSVVHLVSSAIDVSDGLYADLQKLLSASSLGGSIVVEKIPLSDALRATYEADRQIELALTGGDDYELCFTSGAALAEIEAAANACGLAVTRIGTTRADAGLDCQQGGKVMEFTDKGYRHFA